MKEDVIHAGILYRYIPHYRLDVFRELQRDDGINVTVCAFDDYSSTDRFLLTKHPEKGFPFIAVRTWFWRIPFTRHNLHFQPYAVWSMLTRKFDVYIMGNTFLEVSVWMNLFLARLLRRHVCLWGHGFSLPSSRVSRFFRRIIMHLAHAVVFYTEGDRHKWIKRGMPPEKLFVAYNAVDTRLVSTIKARVTARDIAVFQQEKGLAGKKTVIYIGRLLAYKKPDVLIRAMKQVVERIPLAHLVMIGDGPMRPELGQLVADLHLSAHVTLTGTIYEEETLAKFHLCSRVSVMPASAGLSVQHSFGYGVPMIVGDNMDDHSPEVELVTEGVTGMFCRDGDPGDFARAICELLTDDEKRKRMSVNGLKLIEEKYNCQKMASGILDAIRYCLGKRPEREPPEGA